MKEVCQNLNRTTGLRMDKVQESVPTRILRVGVDKATIVPTSEGRTHIKFNDSIIDGRVEKRVLYRLVGYNSEKSYLFDKATAAWGGSTQTGRFPKDYIVYDGNVTPWKQPSPGAAPTQINANGLSFWSFNPSNIGVLSSEDNIWVSPTTNSENLSFTFDGDYKLTRKDGLSFTITHYHLQPTRSYSETDFWTDLCAVFHGYTINQECTSFGSSVLRSSSLVLNSSSSTGGSSSSSSASTTSSRSLSTSTFFDPTNAVQCCGTTDVVQYSLFRCWNDEINPPDVRFDAMVLMFWEDLYSTPLDELKLDLKKRWAVDFIHCCVKNYPPTDEEMGFDLYLEDRYRSALDQIQTSE